MYAFVLFSLAHLQHLVFLTSRGWGKGVFQVNHERNAYRAIALSQLPKRTADRDDQCILLVLILLCLLSVTVMLFYPLFDCVLFSLITLIPECSGQKCLNFY